MAIIRKYTYEEEMRMYDLERAAAMTQPSEAENDPIKKLDLAMQVLTIVWQDTHSDEIADVLDMLGEYREQYIRDNGQFGVGA